MEVDEVQAEFEAEEPLVDFEVPQPEAEEPLAQEEEPQTEAENPLPEAEMPPTKEARPSTTPLAKLAQKVDKLEADIGLVLVNQQYIIHLLNNLQ